MLFRSVHGAVAAEDLGVLLVQEPDLHLVLADLGALPLEAEYQVQAGVHGGELLHPDVLEDPQHGQLARLIDDRVVGDDGEIEVQESDDPDGGNDVVLLDLIHHIHSLGDLAEDGVYPVKMRLGGVGDEELAASGVLTGMRHR